MSKYDINIDGIRDDLLSRYTRLGLDETTSPAFVATKEKIKIIEEALTLAKKYEALLKAIEAGRLAVVPLNATSGMVEQVVNYDYFSLSKLARNGIEVQFCLAYHSAVSNAPSLDELLNGE